MDGTFHQTAPLDRLKGSMSCHSVDLSSATDRFPLLMLFEVFQYFFGRSFSSSVVNSALACNRFDVPFCKRKRDNTPNGVSFVAGQPLGYLGSWPLFALSHHLVVMDAAEQAYPGRYFDQYAVLGDDVVITDDKVTQIDLQSMSELQVDISLQKSLVSHTGCGEFAKRFRVGGLEIDLSPVTVNSLTNCHHPRDFS